MMVNSETKIKPFQLHHSKNLPDSVINVLENIILPHEKVEKVILYGSRAVGDHHERSDVDIAIVAPDMTMDEFVQLWNDVDEGPTLFEIQLYLYRELSEKMHDQIEEYGVTLYERKKAS